MGTPMQARLRQVAAHHLQCEVPGCYYRRHKISRLCRDHMRREQATGHPLGWTIRKAWLRPYQEEADRYIQSHREDPHVQRSLTMLDHILTKIERPRGPCHKDTRKAAIWVINLRDTGVTADAILACVIGMYLMQERDPRRFKNDRHFVHQVVIRILRLAPAPSRQAWDGKREHRIYQRVSVGVMWLLGRLFIKAAGATALRVTRTIEQERQEQQDMLLKEFMP